MSEVYQAAYMAAFYAQQQQLQQHYARQAAMAGLAGMGPMGMAGMMGMPQAAYGAMGVYGNGMEPLSTMQQLQQLQMLQHHLQLASALQGYNGMMPPGMGMGMGMQAPYGGMIPGGPGPRGHHELGGRQQPQGPGRKGFGAARPRRVEAVDPAELDARFGSLEECAGQICAMARDQHGCRFLQRRFDESGSAAVDVVFEELLTEIGDLMMDPFANYLIQKLLDVCTEEQRSQVLTAVAAVVSPETAQTAPANGGEDGDGPAVAADSSSSADPALVEEGSLPPPGGMPQLVAAALNTHGTRAVQKLVETLSTPEQVSLAVAALSPGVVVLVKDLNGNHVVQRCLQRLSSDQAQFIYDAAGEHCVEIATHRHGCCVLQRCIDHATEEQRRALVSEVAAQALVLAQDPYGNYVVQYVLNLGLPWASALVMVTLGGSYAELSMQKFSSNVVEKCLKLGESQQGLQERLEAIVVELTHSPALERLLQDPFGNYVVQSALSVTTGQLHADLVDRIRPHIAAIRSSPYGKRILARSNLLGGQKMGGQMPAAAR